MKRSYWRGSLCKVPKSYLLKQYRQDFSGKRAKALEQALDIRKFEIELYWKRASYFWTFIGATLAGYIAVAVSSAKDKADLLVVLSSLGLVFSFAWLLVNRGSKFWQENWENHVDLLEDQTIGPLFKIVLKRPKPNKPRRWAKHLLTGPSPFSVSKINQIVSLFILALWLILMWDALEFSLSAPVDKLHFAVVFSSLLGCILMFAFGRTYEGHYIHVVTKRRARFPLVIKNKR